MIKQETVKKFGYETTEINGKRAEIANFYRDGKLVAQHIRGPEKKFIWVGDTKGVTLWGQNLWAAGGKKLVITEGEYDCMTVSQLQDNRWPVVSLPNGSQSAVRAIKDNFEWVSSFDEVILMFDMDKPGQDAAVSVAEILPPGRAKIASLPYKDANECLMQGKGRDILTAMWQAQRYSPDEILHVSNIVENTDIVDTRVYPFPFDKMTDFLIGQRSGEITLWSSGTGSGKSTILRELMVSHLVEGRSVGAIMLEESPQETMDDMISLLINKPVRAQKAMRIMNELRAKMGSLTPAVDIINEFTDEEYAEARRKLSETNLYIYDHLGHNALSNLVARMEFMAVSLDVDVIVLDHITAAAAGLLGNSGDFAGGESERLVIDNIMKELRSLVSRTGVRIDVVSQLKKTNKAYEEGDRITLQDLRGSGSLSSVPNVVLALERDRQNPDPKMSNTTTVRVLKNRLTGRAGVAACLFYDHETGRTREIDFALDDGGAVVIDPTD
tara:strand:- start:12881 stop:14374 length:1494 start_codon:yes stop_codon:yes gene_type:complete